MEYYDTIIVGAGPAGSTCAWKLSQAGRSTPPDWPPLTLAKGFPQRLRVACWPLGKF